MISSAPRSGGERVGVTVQNGVLIHEPDPAPGAVDATLSVRRADLVAALLGGPPLTRAIASGTARIAGNPAAFAHLIAMLDAPPATFPLVLPRQ